MKEGKEINPEEVFGRLMQLAMTLGWDHVAFERGGDSGMIRGIVLGSNEFLHVFDEHLTNESWIVHSPRDNENHSTVN